MNLTSYIHTCTPTIEFLAEIPQSLLTKLRTLSLRVIFSFQVTFPSAPLDITLKYVEELLAINNKQHQN